MNDQGPLRIAIVGCGRFGVQLGRIMIQDMEGMAITALASRSESSRQRILAQLELDVPAFTSLDELLEKAADRIDAVALTGANYEHRDQAITAAQAGKHIFCEKPMALTSDDCQQMVEAAQEHGVKLMVGHKRRLRPAWQRLTEIVHSGQIGTPVAININGWHYPDSIASWWLKRDLGGGLLHRAGVHDIDYMHAVMGEPKWVSALASPPASTKADFPVTMWVTIGFQSGAVGGLQVSLWYALVHFRDSFCVQVLGTNGSALLSRFRNSDQWFRQEIHWGREGRHVQCENFTDKTEGYVRELRSFVRWVREDAPPLLSWREGWRCVQIMEAAYRSAEANGIRIELEDLPQA